MAAISRRGQGGRIYNNNTRARVLLRRMCVKPADLTTHTPPQTFARPRTATRPPEHFRSPTQPRRMPAGCAMPSPPTAQHLPRRRPSLAPAQRHALAEHFCSPTQPRRTPADRTTHSPPQALLAPAQRHALPEHFCSPTQRRCIPHCPHNPFPPKTCSRPRTLPLPHAAPTHTRRLRDAFLADLTTHSPPKISSHPRTTTRPSRTLPLPLPAPTHTRRLRDAFLAAPTTHSPPKACSRPRTATRPSQALSRSLPAPTHTRRLRDARPLAARCIPRRPHNPFPQRHAASPSVPLRAQKNGTAQRVCDAECLGRPSCGRSFGLVSRALFAAVAGRWRVGVGLRPQPWALRSRRCGRALRA